MEYAENDSRMNRIKNQTEYQEMSTRLLFFVATIYQMDSHRSLIRENRRTTPPCHPDKAGVKCG